MDEFPESGPPTDTDPLQQAPTLDASRSRLYSEQEIAGRYKILKRLGRGEMGEVWHAFDQKLRVDIALKSVRRSSPEAVEALRREVRTAREVISANVCRIFDLIIEAGQELISMEYIDGLNLLALLRDKSPLELTQAHEIASQFLAGLEAIHQAGLVHRDLKPENIMITRTGRVVVMDFGIAEQLSQISGSISGTPPYMPPEQLAGEKIDARVDIFAAGAVLAEMISSIRDHKSREAVWNAIREDPPELPEGPWQRVIARAVARNPKHRFPSVASLSRALEEVTQRVETIEERKPYPGLSAFTEADTGYFFGRELELENVLKKVQELPLLAIIGPSGAGKTSFLRAGLIPSLPSGWNSTCMQPGDSPFMNLGQSLDAEFSGDPKAIQKMAQLQDPETALWLLHRWRQRHPHTLLIVDRFEELFTLNNREVQTRFAELLGRAVLEADVHVLLAMRDDFLLLCDEHPALAPIFSELTPMRPLSGPALRRALVQPAMQSGYRFEDEALIDEILGGVEKERGALPLMAFAAARLWEKRNRKEGLLTRAAYRETGGVSGALAQHAEVTMERIGAERHLIVRQIFRNLVTAQNTRAARDADEILSIFENRVAAEEVLAALIDARLLNSFEALVQEGEKPRRRVEIIHESLLSAWPRLVRWQTQDADSAQFRDQVRQAAHVWQDRGRSKDLLWTGAAYKEFEVWRDKYAGGLTSIEKAFADAMTQHARKQRKRRRIFLGLTFAILIGVLAIIVSFWRGAEMARQDAVSQANRAEAGKLLALGRSHLDADPGKALGYALASLEKSDTSDGRRFAMESLWKGPIPFVTTLPVRPLTHTEFSPDGKWLSVGGIGGVRVVPHSPGVPIIVSDYWPKDFPWWTSPVFSPNGDLLIWQSTENLKVANVWSVSKKKLVRTFKMEGFTGCSIRGGKAFFVTDITGKFERERNLGPTVVRTWNFDHEEPKMLGPWNATGVNAWDIDASGKVIGYAKGQQVFVQPLDALEVSPATFIGKHTSNVTTVRFHPRENQIASADTGGEIRVWSFIEKEPLLTFSENDRVNVMFFNHSGTAIAIGMENKTVRIRNLAGPLQAEPIDLLPVPQDEVSSLAFDPTGSWIAITRRETLLFYPLNRSYPYVFRGSGVGGSNDVRFTPEGRSVVTSFAPAGIVQVWQITGHSPPVKKDLWKIDDVIQTMDVDPAGRYVLAGTASQGMHLISLEDGKSQRLASVVPSTLVAASAFSTDGQFAAGGFGLGDGIQIWNLKEGSVRVLEKSKGGGFVHTALKFSPDGSLFSGDMAGYVYRWDLKNDDRTLMGKGKGMVSRINVSEDGHYVVVCILSAKDFSEVFRATSEVTIYDLQTGASRKVTSHGNRVLSANFDRNITMLITGDLDGVVRVGPITGAPPHLLYGHQSEVLDVRVDPSGKWIVSSEFAKPVVSLWAMPEGEPFHTIPYDKFLSTLRGITNTRVVTDKDSPSGYRIQSDRFPGWEKVPTW